MKVLLFLFSFLFFGRGDHQQKSKEHNNFSCSLPVLALTVKWKRLFQVLHVSVSISYGINQREDTWNSHQLLAEMSCISHFRKIKKRYLGAFACFSRQLECSPSISRHISTHLTLSHILQICTQTSPYQKDLPQRTLVKEHSHFSLWIPLTFVSVALITRYII